MINAVIIEDDQRDSNLLSEYIGKFTEEKGIKINISVFSDGLEYFDAPTSAPDVIFIDIEMPHMNGLEVAKRIRQTDSDVLICFITNLAQFAIEGYSVNAFDFVLKPVSYYAFMSKLNKICNEILLKKKDYHICLFGREGVENIAIANILYFEVIDHSISIYLADGRVVKTQRTLSSFAKELGDKHFVLCNSCYLVNIEYIDKVDVDFVSIGTHHLKISRPKRKEFLKEVVKYFSGTK